MALELLTLPGDILLDILEHLSQNDLFSLALVSSQTKDLAQRVLYRSICLNLKPPTVPDAAFVAAPSNLHIFQQLVGTLSQKVHLRRSVTALTINVVDHSSLVRFVEHESLLKLVSCLQSLSLDPPPAHLQFSSLSLPLLEELSLNFSIQSANRENIIARQFWVPTLRRLYIDGLYFAPKMSFLFPPDLYRTASITDLQFCNSGENDMGCLPDIILCVKSLERFTFEIFTPWDASKMPGTLAPKTFDHFLRVHAGTLEQLEIAASDAAEFSCASVIGSLKGYSNVKRLAIPEPFLFIVEDDALTLLDVLPPNLEELQLQFPMLFTQGKDKYRATRIRRLEHLAAAKQLQFPAMKRVIWWSQPAECWDDGKGLRYGSDSDMAHLADTFRDVGVKFEWLTAAFFADTPFRFNNNDIE